MESVLGRYRNLIILVGVLFLQVLGLATQVKRSGSDAEHTRLIRVWVVGAITPFERGLVWIENGTGNLWHNYFYLRGVRAENRQLKEQIEQMRLEQVRLSEDAAQARRLQILLGFKEKVIARTIAAQVIGSSGSDLSRIIYIDKGEEDGLKRDMAVITADGIVGKILQVYKTPRVSQVLLINDQSSGVGAILEKTRLQGVLRGTAAGEVVLERVMSDEQVSVGDTLMTSGGDQIFPKGLPVGSVAKVTSGKDLFLTIKVKPAANLSKLEEVLVLVEKPEKQSVADETTHTRAADILAQRLPSVPDKPPADAATSTTPGSGTTANPATKLQPSAKPDVKPQTGTATKPQNPAAAAKPAGTNVAAGASTSDQQPVSASKPPATGQKTGAQKSTAAKKASTPQVNPESPAAPKTTQPLNPPPAQSDSPPPADEGKPN